MEFVDTHCHIQSSDRVLADAAGEAVTRSLWQKAGYPSGDQLIARAAGEGVARLICVGCSLPDSRLAVSFTQGRAVCYASIGIHPHEAGLYIRDGAPDTRQLDEFAALALDKKVIAVGECGLDYYYNHSEPDDQAKLLRWQMTLAAEHDLPMIFHVREALADFWPIFDSFSGLRGVLHSYTDNQANLELALSRGLYVGVNGIATFTKSQDQLEMYKSIPLSRLLLETDSPFLTPSPWRGKICEPYHTRVVAEFLAELRGEPLAELAAATTVNARKLFTI